LSTAVITELEALEGLSGEWTDLWNRCPGATSFQRPEWVLSWTQAFRPKQLLAISVWANTTLVALAPLFLYRSGQEQILAPLAASVSDYLDWLIEPAFRSESLQQIFATLESADFPWTRLDVTDVPGNSPLLEFNFDGWQYEQSPETVCPVLTIPAGAKSITDILSAKPRHNLRTARRRTEKAGNAQIEIADVSTLHEFLTAMMRLHGLRWADCGASGMLSEERVQEFHRRAAPALLRRGVLRLYGLRLNGTFIATLYALT
jgi:CelD/BcsL family acetyltransferase involved in cellulose biosynthesis